MKTSIQSLGTAAALCLAIPGAWAQTSGVTLYGVVEAFAYSKQLANEKRTKQLANGPVTTSFWGIRATEDLGSGLGAVADLVGFLQIDTGGAQRSPADAGGFWGKYAWVGLQSSKLGSIRMGRQTTPTFLNTVRFEPWGGSSGFGTVLHTYVPTGSQPMLTASGAVGVNSAGTSAGGDSAWNNSIGYVSPALGGFSMQALVAAGEGAAAPAPGKRYSMAFFYNAGPLGIGLSADRIDHASGVVVRTASDPAGAPYVMNKLDTKLVSASYDLGVVKLFGQFNASTLSVNSNPDIKLKTTQLGANAPVGVGFVIGSWLHTTRTQSGVADKKRDTVSIGYDYFLSKRTDVYVAAMNDRVTALNSGTGFGVGLRHRF